MPFLLYMDYYLNQLDFDCPYQSPLHLHLICLTVRAFLNVAKTPFPINCPLQHAERKIIDYDIGINS